MNDSNNLRYGAGWFFKTNVKVIEMMNNESILDVFKGID